MAESIPEIAIPPADLIKIRKLCRLGREQADGQAEWRLRWHIQSLDYRMRQHSTWHQDGEGILRGGPVGGDGAGPSSSLRLINSAFPLHTITIHGYAYDPAARSEPCEPGQFDVEIMILYEEWSGLPGPNSDVIHAEIEYSHPYDIAFPTEDRADGAAVRKLDSYSVTAERDFTWNPIDDPYRLSNH
ncbi:hypothetical protein GCM10010124_01980 [Pilimelia terevasa]|uniref:Uncharacterized protein n=1 Tax=Pilimelia terevasa TaxID=53372 RepID=A0A8J3BI98_9ACTN|nr:hypothetical protein [Pilimelia terevasa]GGK13048.1 hypothetical protein GCM10010124_01980 [Pilimelia terevasa]